MEEQVRRLERSVRFLTLAVAAVVVLQAWTALRPTTPGGAPMLLPQAHGQQMMTLEDGKRPEVILTTSQSGATLYEWRFDKESGNWIKNVN